MPGTFFIYSFFKIGKTAGNYFIFSSSSISFSKAVSYSEDAFCRSLLVFL